jgi:hypothetical protein
VKTLKRQDNDKKIQNIKDKKVYSEDSGLESLEGLEGSEGSHGVAQKDRAISWFRWMDSSKWFRQMTIQMVQESRQFRFAMDFRDGPDGSDG